MSSDRFRPAMDARVRDGGTAAVLRTSSIPLRWTNASSRAIEATRSQFAQRYRVEARPMLESQVDKGNWGASGTGLRPRRVSPRHAKLYSALVICVASASSAVAQENEEALAKQLSNPVAALISVPFQLNWDHDFGPDRTGHKFSLNFQPVIPIKLNDDWVAISRTIVPIVDQRVPFIGDGSQSGVGDILQSVFFSPSKPTANGIIWGAGPALLVPTHADFISGDKWGLGPTAVILKQESGWTYGILANHIWSVGGSGTSDISSTFLQPFLSYTTKDAWTFGVNTESTYDWKQEQWTVPVNLTVSKLLRIGKQPLSIGVGARYYADSPSAGPHGWGARLTFTFLFPE
jgi:hypothetical protein